MKDQNGVTLIELLVIILIMGIIFVPISNLVIVSIKSDKEVTVKNELQREARIIMEILTEKMRDNARWVENVPGSDIYSLKKDTDVFLTYYPERDATNIIGGKMIQGYAGTILSDNIIFNIDDIILSGSDSLSSEVHLILEKEGYETVLNSKVYYNRFN